ncbi:TIGR01777 family oxidoreductase [Aestuariimicrobium soli]|uniref:TIGR01777 family oxidoreductase n=1 Tax=Aestuariimicrobium soli TaxID=2035834 RepID=UPI003EBF4E82
MRIAITGSHGLIGHALTQHLRRGGHEVVRLVRSAPVSPDERRIDLAAGRIEAPGLADVDAVVNLAGSGIAGARWTAARKRDLRSSRLSTTLTVVNALSEQGEEGRCRVLLSGSAIGFYGDRGDEVLTETSAGGRGFLAHLVRDWEQSAGQAPEDVRVVTLRTGHVIAATGGLIGKQALFYKLGLGGRIGSGRQWVSWISLRDWCRAAEHLLTSQVAGPVNLVGPAPVRNADLTKALGRAYRRPTWLPLPLPVARLVFGSEMVADAMLAGQRVMPEVLAGDGFAFTDATIDEALAGAGVR